MCSLTSVDVTKQIKDFKEKMITKYKNWYKGYTKEQATEIIEYRITNKIAPNRFIF